MNHLVRHGDHVYAATGEALVALNLADGQELWRFTAPVPWTPIFKNTDVLVQANETLYALSSTDGAVRWRFQSRSPNDIRRMIGLSENGERVYTMGYANYLGGEAILHSLDAATGKEVWRHTWSSFPAFASLQTASDGTVIVQVNAGFGACALYAFAKNSGAPTTVADLCTNTCVGIGGACDDGGYLEPMLYRTCAFGTDCADCGPRPGPAPEASILWQRTPAYLDTPVVDDAGAIFFTETDAEHTELLIKLRTDGTVVWTTAGQSSLRPILAGDRVVANVTANTMGVFNASTGSKLWSYAAAANVAIGPTGLVVQAGDFDVVGLNPSPNAVLVETLACSPCASTCLTKQQTARCAPDGSSQYPSTSCASDHACSAGVCVACTPKAYKECSSDSIYWWDSCDRIGELATQCPSGYGCSNAECLPKGTSCSCGCQCRSCTTTTSSICGTPSVDCGSCARVCAKDCSTCGGVSSYSGGCQ